MGNLSLSRVYGGDLAPIDEVKALIVQECDPTKVADFVSAVEAAKKRDGKTLERKNYWGELSLWSRRRLGELIRIGQAEGTLAAIGRPAEKGCTEQLQLHVPKSQHINAHPNCLHLWKPPYTLKLPPTSAV